MILLQMNTRVAWWTAMYRKYKWRRYTVYPKYFSVFKDDVEENAEEETDDEVKCYV